MTGTVLLTGGTGFIGAAALGVLRRQPGIRRIRLLVHRRPFPAPAVPDRPEGPAGAGLSRARLAGAGRVELAGHVRDGLAEVECVQADLARPPSLAGICAGVDTVVHLAALIGGDEQSCQAVNHDGTAALVAEARRAGVARFILLSTAAVYGDGVFRGQREEELVPAPVSPTSRSRFAAEQVVRAAGGVVLRPQFVLGPGDTWVAPTLSGMLAALGGWVDGGVARLSVIRVDELARVIAVAASTPRLWPGAVYHANHPRPVSVREMAAAVADPAGTDAPTGSVPLAEAERILPAPFTLRQLRLLFTDHWFDSFRIWRDLALSPSSHPL